MNLNIKVKSKDLFLFETIQSELLNHLVHILSKLIIQIFI